jgi:sugar/nucleoside kinase (ribokinase family)
VRFVAVGDVLVDVLSGEVPRAGERAHGQVTIRAGGSAATATVWAAALDATARVVGRVGSDPAGELIAGVLTGRGIEADLARDPDVPTGAAIALGAGTSIAAPEASAGLAPDDVPDPLDGDALLVSGFSLFQDSSAPGARAALERFSGKWAAIDLASPRLAGAAAGRFEETTAGANVVLATVDEARAVTGLEQEAAALALGARFEVACVKLGGQGALAAQGDRLVRAKTDPVARRSPFGAGDAFAAALLIALARGQPLEHALDLACQTGARAAASADGWPE